MNEKMLTIQAIIQQMKPLVDGLEDLADKLPQNPKLYADKAEAPLQQMLQMLNELDDLFDEFKPPSLQRAAIG
jgi:hypothetical protein